MMRSLYSGVSGLKTHQTKMDVIGNNIANVNTVAFKSSTTVFSELMYQNITGASGPSATGRGGINAKQIGLGVTTASTSVNISSPGASQTTGEAFDLKIAGDSFFVVNDGSTNFFTKAGSFYIDGAGNLAMKSTGYNVMGWQVDPTTGEIKKDTVSALRIMQEKNKTSAPEATTNAVCSGILDKNSSDVNNVNGQMMSLSFYDALGYTYTAKFAIKSNSNSMDTGTYSVELADILDSKGKSVLDKYLTENAGSTVGDLFGIQQTVVDNFGVNTTAGYSIATPLTNPPTYQYNDGTNPPHTLDPVGFPTANTPADDPHFEYTVGGVVARVEVSSFFSGMTADAVNNFNTSNIKETPPGSGTYSYEFAHQGYNYNLDFNENNGLFSYINTAGTNDVPLNLSKLGGNFSDITVDFSTTKWVDNKGTSTIGMERGSVDDITAGTGKPLGALEGLSVSNDGTIWGSYDNGNTVLLGQIATATFANPSGLEKVGENCYQTTLNSGQFDGIGQDVTADGGSMTSGVLEMSNVDLSSEFTEMITTQRGFQANSRIITTSDSLLEELINLKR